MALQFCTAPRQTEQASHDSLILPDGPPTQSQIYFVYNKYRLVHLAPTEPRISSPPSCHVAAAALP